jgi:hypothetical protein
MSPAEFRKLVYPLAPANNDPFDAMEAWAHDLYLTLVERPNSPLRTVLCTVVRPCETQHAIDLIRCRIDGLELSGMCDAQHVEDWRAVLSTVVAIHELTTGSPEDTE